MKIELCSRVVALIAPRQSGKTTLARHIVPADSPSYFDLEDPVSLARLAEPMTILYPGTRRYALADRVVVVPALELARSKPGAIIAGP